MVTSIRRLNKRASKAKILSQGQKLIYSFGTGSKKQSSKHFGLAHEKAKLRMAASFALDRIMADRGSPEGRKLRAKINMIMQLYAQNSIPVSLVEKAARVSVNKTHHASSKAAIIRAIGVDLYSKLVSANSSSKRSLLNNLLFEQCKTLVRESMGEASSEKFASNFSAIIQTINSVSDTLTYPKRGAKQGTWG